MSFILANERDEGPREMLTAFAKYRRYVEENRAGFPSGAYELASSNWYFDFHDHRCPHDGWLESLTMNEAQSGADAADRHCSIRLRLLGAYHDCIIEMHYPIVYSYQFENRASARGNRGWRYDEFRLSEGGRLVHEIEWAGSPGEEARWVIEAADVEFRVLPIEGDRAAEDGQP